MLRSPFLGVPEAVGQSGCHLLAQEAADVPQAALALWDPTPQRPQAVKQPCNKLSFPLGRIHVFTEEELQSLKLHSAHSSLTARGQGGGQSWMLEVETNQDIQKTGPAWWDITSFIYS